MNGNCPDCPTCGEELRKIEGGYVCDVGKDSCMQNNRWPSLFYDEQFMRDAEAWLKRKAAQ